MEFVVWGAIILLVVRGIPVLDAVLGAALFFLVVAVVGALIGLVIHLGASYTTEFVVVALGLWTFWLYVSSRA